MRCFIRSEANGDRNNNGGLHNDEQKTKAMEQQLTQLAQENDALRAQLAAAGVEIENVKSELAKPSANATGSETN